MPPDPPLDGRTWIIASLPHFSEMLILPSPVNLFCMKACLLPSVSEEYQTVCTAVAEEKCDNRFEVKMTYESLQA